MTIPAFAQGGFVSAYGYEDRPKRSIWIGFEPREFCGFSVTRSSLRRNMSVQIPINGLILSDLQENGLYNRPTKKVLGRLHDELSRRVDYNGAISTEFAVSRFFVPLLAGEGMALFMDCDMLAKGDVGDVFRLAEANPDKAVWCVKHDHRPETYTKMDNCVQTQYDRKNWSSFCLFNCGHPSNAKLTLDLLNTAPGRDLHAFCWLEDHEIGELGPQWNYLIGHTENVDPKIVHFTDGIPTMPGFENVPFAEDWHKELRACAR